jgi:hypothetical protein
MPINPSGIPAWMSYKPQLLIHPSFDVVGRNYDRFRIPRPPEFDPEGTAPGLICWGTVGQMPSAQPMPGVDFNVHTERSRRSEDVRIENPDDANQYVIADRAKEITFDSTKNDAPPGPNTSSKPAAGFDDYTPIQKAQFIASGIPPAATTLTLRYKQYVGSGI